VKISFNTLNIDYRKLNKYNGFGNAGNRMIDTLESLGYDVSINDHTADVGFVFNHPRWAMFYPHQYNILYFPWESTELQEGWPTVMDACDEIWTPSNWCKDIFENFTTTPVYVYEHGVGEDWVNRKRYVKDTFNFLNVGAEAARKNGWSVVRAFRKAFPHNPEVRLTMKMLSHVSVPLPPSLGKVTYINERWPLAKLQKEHYKHHVYVYPSSSEGFGLTPLQAMASGMPTICTENWAPYADLLDPDLALHGTLGTTNWEEIHPGKLFIISEDETIDRMRYAYDNFDSVAQNAYDLAPKVHERYNWRTLTASAFGDLKKRLS